MNLTIKLTSLTSLILKFPRILQGHHGTNSSKEKEKKDTLTKMPLPQGWDVLHMEHPHFRTKEAFFFVFLIYLVFSLLLYYRS